MIKIDMIMLAIWIAVFGVLNTVNVGITTWQYWVLAACFFAVELRATFVAKKEK